MKIFTSGNGNVHCHFGGADNHTNDNNTQKNQHSNYGVQKYIFFLHCIA